MINQQKTDQEIRPRVTPLCSFVVVTSLLLTGCGATDSSSAESNPAEEAPEVPNLTGTWQETNSTNEDSYQEAVVTEDSFSIDWVSDGGDTKSVYWVGTFDPPTDEDQPYTWVSERDVEATDTALLASTSDTKEFTFHDDTISYEVTALGTTKKVELEKQDS